MADLDFQFSCFQTEGEVQILTKKVRALEEDFESTENKLRAASEKLEQATKAADDSKRFASPNNNYNIININTTAIMRLIVFGRVLILDFVFCSGREPHIF